MRQIVSFRRIAHKEVLRILRIWTQTFIPPVVTTTLYFLIFGNLLGSRIADIQGFSYINFIVPGLIMMSVITNSYTNVASSFFGSKFQKSIEELIVSPTKTTTIIMGYITGGIVRGIGVGICVSFVALLFTKITLFDISVVLSIVFLTSIVFSLMGLFNGILARSFDGVGIVPIFVITPLTYLGGIFYSVSILPPLWRTVTLGNPIFYIINAFRYGFLGISEIPLVYSYIMLFFFIVLLYTLCHMFLVRGGGMKS